MSLTPPSPHPVRQPSLFSTEAADPSLADLAGLLAGPGEVVRMGGTARLAVVVPAAWRVHVLVAELDARGVAASWEPTEDGRHLVRSAYATTLAPLATAWLHGTVKRPPANFHLNGRRLRLWLAAAGRSRRPGSGSASVSATRSAGRGYARRWPRWGCRGRSWSRRRAGPRTGSPGGGWPGWPSWWVTARRGPGRRVAGRRLTRAQAVPIVRSRTLPAALLTGKTAGAGPPEGA
ncbi:hypothetical protein GA0074695_6526 [Micromonospora viridifaciens]|uniref:Uncharacterized protein n=1 Tax=Micromonospora viridifaciens TaxID=1881 RepID=A0A1C5A287_MICVI|nr:hypothetical protein GA0074695_6526 [Micromonospora viridifaciens]